MTSSKLLPRIIELFRWVFYYCILLMFKKSFDCEYCLTYICSLAGISFTLNHRFEGLFSIGLNTYYEGDVVLITGVLLFM